MMNGTSTMLFGSVARGDHYQNSDIDYLIVSDKKNAFIKTESPKASVSRYSWTEFDELVAKKMPFVQHLKQEGVILKDECGRLAESLASFTPRENYYDEFKEALSLLRLLEFIPSQALSRYWYADVLFVILRNLMILKLANNGEFIFSQSKLALRFGEDVWANMQRIRNKKIAYRQRNFHNSLELTDLIKTINVVTKAVSIDFTPTINADNDFISNLINLTESPNSWYCRVRASEGLLFHCHNGNIPSKLWDKHKSIITNIIGYRFFPSQIERDGAIFSIVEDALSNNTL